MVAYLDRSMSSISTRRSLYVAVRGHKEDLFCWAIYRRKTPQGVKLSEGGLPYVDQASTPLIAWYRPLDLSAQPLCLGHREENDPEPSLRPSLPSIFSSTTDSPQQPGNAAFGSIATGSGRSESGHVGYTTESGSRFRALAETPGANRKDPSVSVLYLYRACNLIER
jgi:hypothetical protein